jgi:hypothetical protein
MVEANKKGEEDWFCSKIKSSTSGKIKQNIEGCKFILGLAQLGINKNLVWFREFFEIR